MLTSVWDLLADSMNPIEGVEQQSRVSRQWMKRCCDRDPTLRGLGDTAELKRGAGDVGGEFFEPVRFIVEDELACMNGKARGTPLQQLVHERFREALGTVETFQE